MLGLSCLFTALTLIYRDRKLIFSLFDVKTNFSQTNSKNSFKMALTMNWHLSKSTEMEFFH